MRVIMADTAQMQNSIPKPFEGVDMITTSPSTTVTTPNGEQNSQTYTFMNSGKEFGVIRNTDKATGEILSELVIDNSSHIISSWEYDLNTGENKFQFTKNENGKDIAYAVKKTGDGKLVYARDWGDRPHDKNFKYEIISSAQFDEALKASEIAKHDKEIIQKISKFNVNVTLPEPAIEKLDIYIKTDGKNVSVRLDVKKDAKDIDEKTNIYSSDEKYPSNLIGAHGTDFEQNYASLVEKFPSLKAIPPEQLEAIKKATETRVSYYHVKQVTAPIIDSNIIIIDKKIR
jgi:hypothetical protein